MAKLHIIDYLRSFSLYILIKRFPLAPMRALAPGSAHARPSAQAPSDTSGNFWAEVFGGQKNEKCLNFLTISGDSKHFSFFLEKKLKKLTPPGAGRAGKSSKRGLLIGVKCLQSCIEKILRKSQLYVI